ncbi:hypothetical protein SAMN05421760_105274 [Neptunomonas antarctica]|uniref:Uncharacterized protein n=1 Tax=Neptunomonas antarctica TaxID=619304 RepID=A0A1N7M8X1_9GAMM|nr:hypothetical protein SAMN05421760_105274 [Neptunomonas antarctica]
MSLLAPIGGLDVNTLKQGNCLQYRMLRMRSPIYLRYLQRVPYILLEAPPL